MSDEAALGPPFGDGSSARTSGWSKSVKVRARAEKATDVETHTALSIHDQASHDASDDLGIEFAIALVVCASLAWAIVTLRSRTRTIRYGRCSEAAARNEANASPLLFDRRPRT